VDIFPIVPESTWHFDNSNVWRLLGGHGGDIVRGIYLDEQVRNRRSSPFNPSRISSFLHLSLFLFFFFFVYANIASSSYFASTQKSTTVYSCGEDGKVRAWKPEDSDNKMMGDDVASPISPSVKMSRSKDTKEKKPKEDKRYKPY
jgi:WD repeat-containing protein 89